MVKLLGISASPRAAATDYFVKATLEEAAKNELVETQYISFKGKTIASCNQCDYCKRNKVPECIIKDDFQEIAEAFLKADALLVASPVYVYSAAPQLYAFFSRLRAVFHNDPSQLKDKFGAAMAVGGERNGGQETTVGAIINLMMTRGVNMVSNEARGYLGSYLWSQDKKAEGAKADEHAMEKARGLVNKLVRVAIAFKLGQKELEKRGE